MNSHQHLLISISGENTGIDLIRLVKIVPRENSGDNEGQRIKREVENIGTKVDEPGCIEERYNRHGYGHRDHFLYGVVKKQSKERGEIITYEYNTYIES